MPNYSTVRPQARRPVRETVRHTRTTARVSGGGFRNRLFSPALLAVLALIALIGAAVLIYYYQHYTKMIDAGLRGDIFVRSSGIYAAPYRLRNGAPARLNDLIAHLKRVGYLEAGTTENEKRGLYALRGNVVEISPGADTSIDGAPQFRRLRVAFGNNNIQSLSDLATREKLDEALVEPELISSIVNQEREKRKIIEYKDLPQNLVDAIIAVEDRQFFEHSGINWRGILRALVKDYQTGELREGGSSITQQLVKNFFLTDERTLQRKLQEAYISILLEQRLAKEQIMAMYCNQIYLGQRGSFSINGFGQAAKSYFDKDVSQLTLPEAALLAGIIRSPNRYSPFKYEERAKERRDMVLNLMVEAGKVSYDDAEKAKAVPLGLKGKGSSSLDANDAPYFIDYLTKQLEGNYGDRSAMSSLRIHSTLDLGLQRAAYQAVTKHMAGVDKLLARRKGGLAGLQCALVAMDAKTGAILAMVGGRDYGLSQLNRATEARRQPGSVFKPFVYAAALTEGSDDGGNAITPATLFLDSPRTFEYGYGQQYNPGNFGNQYENRKITFRDALVKSKNVITVEIGERVGFSQIARLAERAGIQKVPNYPSMALGVAEATPLQMASAYTTFANQGRRVVPFAYTRVSSSSGQTLQETQRDSRELLSPQVAYIMTSLMKDVLDRGTGTRVRAMGLRATAAGKTGSSRDGWFAGYTPNLVCVVYVGFDDNADLGLTGGVAAAPIWADFMLNALRLRPDLGGEFPDPGDIVTVDIDTNTGKPATADTVEKRHELFLRGTEPGAGTASEVSSPGHEQAITPPDNYDPAATPTPEPRAPTGEQGAARPRTTGTTISVEVCSVTGLLPARNVCTRTGWRSFPFGKEPVDECSEEAHERARAEGRPRP